MLYSPKRCMGDQPSLHYVQKSHQKWKGNVQKAGTAYESTTNLMVISQKCHSKLLNLKLTRNFRGGVQAFITQLENAYLDFEQATGTAKNDLEKKTTLLDAIQDSQYFAIRDFLSIDATKDFQASMAALDQHAAMFSPNSTGSDRESRRLNNVEHKKGRC